MTELFVTDYPDPVYLTGIDYYDRCVAGWRNGCKPWPGNYRERGRVGRLVRPERDPRWPADGKAIEHVLLDECKKYKWL